MSEQSPTSGRAGNVPLAQTGSTWVCSSGWKLDVIATPKGEADARPAVGSAYVRMDPVAPRSPAVPEAAPGALRLPIVGVS